MIIKDLSTVAKISVGDTVCMGKYPSGALGEVESISWSVIAEEEGRYLLVSKYCIDNLPFNYQHRAVIWERSDIREWLSYFFEDQFTEAERSCIVKTVCNNGQDKDTLDYVFLLSADEAKKYFKNDKARRCLATPYAEKRGAINIKNVKGTGWWLRSHGFGVSYASDVFPDGEISIDGEEVYEDGGIRPAMWLKLN